MKGKKILINNKGITLIALVITIIILLIGIREKMGIGIILKY